jgi:hypothetical protein
MRRPVALSAIAFAALLAVALAWPLTAAPMNWDAVHVYLPMARELLARGVAFLADPASVRMAPMAYVYPALLGGDGVLVRHANLALFAGVVAMVGAAAWTAHSPRAGVAAAFATALSPLLRHYMPDAMTEAPFTALVALWLLAVARIAHGARNAWVAVAAIAFALASLTRPVPSLFAPVLAAVFAWRALRTASLADRVIDRRLCVAHTLATLGWAAWVAHNAWSFGFPSIATGGGTALWLGLNPLTDGFDPWDYGLEYDDGSIDMGANHLAIAADLRLRDAAMLQLHDLPLGALAGMAAHKAAAFLFGTMYDVSDAPVAWLRAWRIVLVVLALAALVLQRRSRTVQVAAAFTAYIVLVHLPLLYTLRYTVALDVPLAFLAGIGAIECARDARWMSGAAFAAVLALALGMPAMAERGPGAPHLEHAIVGPIWQRDLSNGEGVRLENMRRDAAGSFVALRDAALEFDVGFPGMRPALPTLATVDLAIKAGTGARGCHTMYVQFHASDEAKFDRDRGLRVPLDADGQTHTYVFGAVHPLGLVRDGVLRLELDCDATARVEPGLVRVLESARGPVYRARLPQP